MNLQVVPHRQLPDRHSASTTRCSGWTPEFPPLLTVDEASYLLSEVSGDRVRTLLDEGVLRGVDIASRSEGARRELRVYRHPIEELLTPGLSARASSFRVEHVLPHRGNTLRQDEVAQVLNCSPRHIANLGIAGPGSCGTTVRYFRRAVIGFLIEREIARVDRRRAHQRMVEVCC